MITGSTLNSSGISWSSMNIRKPFASDALLDSVRRALALRRLVLDNRSLRLALSDRQQLSSTTSGASVLLASRP